MIRGRIRAFYEREIEVDTDLVGSTAALTALGYPTEKPDEAGYTKLDSGVARFLLGTFTAALQGIPQEQIIILLQLNLYSLVLLLMNFHGALVGSSLVEDKGTAAEGTPHAEHNFGGVAGLGDLGGLVISGRGVRQTARS